MMREGGAPVGGGRQTRFAAGIGLKSQFQAEILSRRPALAFLEVHAENYFCDGGAPHRWLGAIAEHYELSVHGVGLSLGGDQPLDLDHLERLAGLVERYRPALVSEHLAWSVIDGIYLNDLLPIRYDEQSLALVAEHVDQVQERLKRRLLIENPATYVGFADHAFSEPQFLAALVKRTGCGILLDVNNIHVSRNNVGLTVEGYFAALPVDAVGEIHLAGHLRRGALCVDDHGSLVCDEVWQLYREALRHFGRVPTLIERDSNIPPLDELLAETARAETIQREERRDSAA